jgi:hypothetical protein
MLWTSQVK